MKNKGKLQSDDKLLREMEIFVKSLYNNCCVIHPNIRAVTLHHEPPKSLSPYWRSYPEDWWPVCAACHDRLHEMKRIDANTELIQARARNFPKVVSQIDEKLKELYG